jgi:threonine/homoserine/homoserine lactone efflux protein
VNTKLLMIISAVFLAMLGVGASFLPDEILAYLGAPRSGALPVLVQLLGAHYLAFAVVNWIAKDSLIGGIYNRPVALGNFAHFWIGTIVLIKVAISGQPAGSIWIACGCYAFFAAWFAIVLFGSPVKAKAAPSK